MFDTDTLSVQAASQRLRLTVSGVPETVRPTAGSARAAVADLLTERRADDFESAVAEALANAVEHGNGPQTRAITVNIDALPGLVVARIRDAGHGQLARGPVDLFAGTEPATEDSERGRGLKMMEGLVDEVEVANENGGRVVELRMRTTPAAEE